MSNTEKNQEIAASKAGMDPTTARRYLGLERLPSELKKERPWRTREDPFGEVWDAVQRQIQESPGLEAQTLFEWLQREYPGRFSDGQIRTLQRRIKLWRVTEGPAREVYFGQKHTPGRLCASDFTHMTELGITLGGQTFEHLVYHFVLTYSNWETGTICYSESRESLTWAPEANSSSSNAARGWKRSVCRQPLAAPSDLRSRERHCRLCETPRPGGGVRSP